MGAAGVFIADVLSLSGAIASVASLPLIVFPVIIYLALKKWEPKVPRWQNNTLIGFFVIGVGAYLTDIADRLGFVDEYIAKIPPKDIYDKVYTNERVPLNGFIYHHCTFTNVTFVINGIKSGGIEYSRMNAYAIATDNPVIETAISFLNGLGALRFPVKVNGKTIQPFGEGTTFFYPGTGTDAQGGTNPDTGKKSSTP
jgi:hypothetical protein